MTALEYESFMEKVTEECRPCKYGHACCSDVKGGKCCDEEWSNLSDEDREDLL
jgi:hypothetical protein